MKISVILPTYNERHNIIELLKNIIPLLPPQSECLVVDDDSPDGTYQLVKRKFAKNKEVRCFLRKGGKDLGKAIGYGLNKARGKVIIIMDTDFNHQPKYLPMFLEEIKNYDLVCGSRYIKGGGMPGNQLRFFGSYIFNWIIRLTLGMHLIDNLSGFVIFKKTILNLLTVKEKRKIFHGFGEWYIRFQWWVKKKGLSVKRIPIKYGLRPYDQSKMNFIRSLIVYTKTVLELRLYGLGKNTLYEYSHFRAQS